MSKKENKAKTGTTRLVELAALVSVAIAHRLHTIAKANKIIVLGNGEAVEEGTHDILMATEGLYKRLYTIQQESLGWSV